MGTVKFIQESLQVSRRAEARAAQSRAGKTIARPTHHQKPIFQIWVAHISKLVAFQTPVCYSPIALPLLICFFHLGFSVFYTLIHTFQFICDFHAHICLTCYFLSSAQTRKMSPAKYLSSQG